MTPLFLALAVLLNPVTEQIRPFDTIKLKNGNVLIGLIRENYETAAVTIALLGSDGTVSDRDEVKIRQEDIAEIIRRRTTRDIFKDERTKRNLMNPTDVLELALWCGRPEVGLKTEALSLGHRALRLAPDRTEVYPLLARLLEERDVKSLSPADRDLEIELALRARQQNLFMGTAFLRAARALILDSPESWTVLTDEAVRLFELVRSKGTEEEQAQATAALAMLYLTWDRLDDLLAILQTASEELKAQLRTEIITRLLLRDTGDDIARAQEYIAALPGGPQRKELEAALALRTGDTARTEALLLEVIDETSSPEAALALGVVLALQKKTKTAAEILKAVPVEKADGMPRFDGLLLKHLLGDEQALADLLTALPNTPGILLLAAAEAAVRGDPDAGDRHLQAFRAQPAVPESIRPLAWVVAATLSVANGADEQAQRQAWRQLLYARAGMPEEWRLSLALANLHAHRGDIARARRYFREGVKQQAPAGQAALSEAYLAYRARDLDTCEELARACATSPDLTASQLGYVTRLSRAVWEATRLESWEDRFTRAGAEVLNGWTEEEKYGVRIELTGGNVRFSGNQTGALDGVTYLYRYVDWDQFYRFTLRLQARSGDCEVGLLATDGRSSFSLVGDQSGTFALVTRRVRAEKREPLNATWKPGQSYTLTVERSLKGQVTFFVNGTPLPAKTRISLRKKGRVKMGCFARALTRGGPVELEVEFARLWRLADTEGVKGVRRGR